MGEANLFGAFFGPHPPSEAQERLQSLVNGLVNPHDATIADEDWPMEASS